MNVGAPSARARTSAALGRAGATLNARHIPTTCVDRPRLRPQSGTEPGITAPCSAVPMLPKAGCRGPLSPLERAPIVHAEAADRTCARCLPTRPDRDRERPAVRSGAGAHARALRDAQTAGSDVRHAGSHRELAGDPRAGVRRRSSTAANALLSGHLNQASRCFERRPRSSGAFTGRPTRDARAASVQAPSTARPSARPWPLRDGCRFPTR